MRHLKWFLTKHGIIVDLMILGAILATVGYFTVGDVSTGFNIAAIVAVSPFALFIVLSLLIGIPVNMIRGKDTGRENWPFIKQWTALQMWFNRPWTKYPEGR